MIIFFFYFLKHHWINVFRLVFSSGSAMLETKRRTHVYVIEGMQQQFSIIVTVIKSIEFRSYNVHFSHVLSWNFSFLFNNSKIECFFDEFIVLFQCVSSFLVCRKTKRKEKPSDSKQHFLTQFDEWKKKKKLFMPNGFNMIMFICCVSRWLFISRLSKNSRRLVRRFHGVYFLYFLRFHCFFFLLFYWWDSMGDFKAQSWIFPISKRDINETWWMQWRTYTHSHVHSI